MISKYLEALKTKRKLTNRQISELSGVSEATIQRVLAGKSETSFDTVAKLTLALGGSLDELAEIKPPEDTELQALRDRVAEQDKTIQALTAQTTTLAESHRYVAESKEKENEYLRRIIRCLASALAIILAFVMFVVAVDIINGSIGWARYEEMHNHESGTPSLVDGVSTLSNWILPNDCKER